MKVLLIEDDAMLQKAVALSLLDAGHTLTLASNGREAMDAIKNNHDIEVIVTDVLMPEVSGPTFILQLKKQYPEGLPCLIIISAVKGGEEFLKSLDIPYDHYLAKPLDIAGLVKLVGGMDKNPS